MPAPKLNTEEKELLADIVYSDGFRVLLKVLDSLAESIERDMITCVLGGDPQEERKLIQLKCRGEGARKLQTSLNLHLAQFKKQSSAESVKSPNK